MSNKFILRKNDRVVFLGDSITEQHLYTNYVESYLATRYPELNLTFFNAGWGGDRAPGGAQRLERDVLSLKPTVVTICYGMNDGSYIRPTPEILKAFTDGMKELIARLKRARIRIVLLTPGFADTSVNPNLKLVDYNAQCLRRLADAVLGLAAKEKLPVFDIHKLMTSVDRKAKKAIKGFTMAPDGFHPSPAGHVVMAYGLLKALGVPPWSRQITVDLAKGSVRSVPGVKVTGPTPLDGGFSLKLSLDRLPFFVEPDARKVLPFVPFQETFNDLSLRLVGHKAAAYYFRMELERSLPYTRAQLGRGINLFSIFGMPAVLRAQAIHNFTNEKCQVYFKLWRGLAMGGSNTDYEPALHRVAIRNMPLLDRVRGRLAAATPKPVVLRLYASEGTGEHVADGDFISTWSFLGPFPKPFGRDHLKGEAAFSASVPLKPVGWKAGELEIRTPGDNLSRIFGARVNALGYAVTVLDSPVEQAAQLLVGSDDGFAAWLNGEPLASRLELKRGVVADEDALPVRLRKGKNVLLFKISQDVGSWGFCARFRGLKQVLIADRPKVSK